MAFETQNSLPANNPEIGSLIDTTLISTSTPEGYVPNDGYEQNLINQYNKQFAPQEIGAQPLGSLYPGANHNINVGGYSGQVIGSGNIYVPGGNIMSVNPVLERRKAIDDAARKRAAEISKPFESPKTPQFTDQKFQQRLNKDYNGFIGNYMSKAKSLYGDNWKVILQDQGTELGREFQQGLQNYETTVKNLNQVTEMVGTIEEGLANNTLYLSPEKRKVYDEYKKMLGSFSDYDTFSKQDIGELHSILMAERDLNDYFNKSGVMANLEAKVNEYSRETDQGLTYVTKEGKTTDWSGVKKDLARELKQTTLRDSSFSEKDIYDALDARLKNQTSSKTSIAEKSQGAIDREGEFNVPSLSENGVFVPYINTDEGKGVVTIKNWNNTGDVTFRSLADYNMDIKGGKSAIYVRGADKTISKVDVNTLDLDNIQIYDDTKKVKQIPGSTKVQLGEMTLLDNGVLVQKAKVFLPKNIMVNEKGEEVKTGGNKIETFEVTDELILLQDEKGQGKSIISAVKSKMGKNTNAIKNYDEAVGKMEEIRKKELGMQPSSGNNVQDNNSDPLGLGL